MSPKNTTMTRKEMRMLQIQISKLNSSFLKHLNLTQKFKMPQMRRVIENKIIMC